MHGLEKEISNTGCPCPGGEKVSSKQPDVSPLSKLYCWGSSKVR